MRLTQCVRTLSAVLGIHVDGATCPIRAVISSNHVRAALHADASVFHDLPENFGRAMPSEKANAVQREFGSEGQSWLIRTVIRIAFRSIVVAMFSSSFFDSDLLTG